MRLETDVDSFHMRLLRIEKLAEEGDEGAQYFLQYYGYNGVCSSPTEWARAFLLGLPSTSVPLERFHREVKRVGTFLLT